LGQALGALPFLLSSLTLDLLRFLWCGYHLTMGEKIPELPVVNT
jgi:hypothetical protein